MAGTARQHFRVRRGLRRLATAGSYALAALALVCVVAGLFSAFRSINIDRGGASTLFGASLSLG